MKDFIICTFKRMSEGRNGFLQKSNVRTTKEGRRGLLAREGGLCILEVRGEFKEWHRQTLVGRGMRGRWGRMGGGHLGTR